MKLILKTWGYDDWEDQRGCERFENEQELPLEVGQVPNFPDFYIKEIRENSVLVAVRYTKYLYFQEFAPIPEWDFETCQYEELTVGGEGLSRSQYTGSYNAHDINREIRLEGDSYILKASE